MDRYKVNNNRELCETHKNKNECQIDNKHCSWNNNKCMLSLTQNMLILFINKISGELAENNLKAFEIMRTNNYYVSDIIDRNIFTEREGQKILKSSSTNAKKILKDLFGETVPIIGKKRILTYNTQIEAKLNADNSLIDMKEYYLQHIISNNLSLYRAYSNGYYWIKNEYSNIDFKNLGYYSEMQTSLANIFKGKVVEWLQASNNKSYTYEKLIKYIDISNTKDPVHSFILHISKDLLINTTCIIELSILSMINRDIPIIVSTENKIKYIFDNGLQYNIDDKELSKINITKYLNYEARRKCINLRFIYYDMINNIPDDVDIIYYK